MCIQAKVMAAAVGGQFKEATIGQIILDDNEPHIVENMLSLLYRQSYDDGQENTSGTPKQNTLSSDGANSTTPNA